MTWEQLINTYRVADTYKIADIRNAFQRDYDRIIFSNIFRRMQNKTQVFPLPGTKMVHNRLTHSLEVASVGRSIARKVMLFIEERHPELHEYLHDIDIIVSTACLAHDLGNPPFGHSGEETLSSYFKEGNGQNLRNEIAPEQWSDLISFEGNANAFRQLTHQFRGRRHGGMSLTFTTLATLIKYPYPSFGNENRKKYNVFYSEIDFFKQIMESCGIPCLDAQHCVYARHPLSFLMEAADDICYLILDMEDAHKRGIVTTTDIEHCFTSFFDKNNPEEAWFFERKDSVFAQVTDNNERMAFLRALVINKLVDKAAGVFINNYDAIMAGTFNETLIAKLPPLENDAMDKCRQFSIKHIYLNPVVVKIEVTGYNIIGTLLSDFVEATLEPNKTYSRRLLSLIPEQFKTDKTDLYSRLQVVLDYISNMTDLYALDLFQTIKSQA